MLPTLAPGDYILFLPYNVLRAFGYLFRHQLVQTGDVVVMNISPELTVCKRVLRSTADASVMRRWNEEQFTELSPEQVPLLESDAASEEFGAECEARIYNSIAEYARSRDWDACLERVERPSAWLWLEGDNPKESFDSRHAGAMPFECLKGLVLLKAWPSLGPLPPRPSTDK
ncbi:mitochondrial inner membrane signal peptidase protein [Trypanosoma rangeli]|uniref:Mitochondrial inner membrane signal peptidase protein n=1 Tax=Trypanosoma rangeli TaxID=5698 RepID=A0A3R7N3L4_TRYRA|nr:mitochondrial inner membrane signal peptidase protein [Trypanosoma rangeli]RNE95878.1 mitochondrial inner membrane signal peptidase protein [Trypanosoma rangeli]|eukprot:RNE95878.1 mitochondrial inner membrane signal peptidase protein [Trypanosoma rangeli]